MTVFISFFIMLVLAAGFSIWLASGLAGLVGLTAGVVTFCQSIFVKCLAYSQMAKVAFLWLGALTFAAGLAWGLYKGVGGLLAARRAVKRLPVKAASGSVVLIDDPENRVAFTHGLIRPRIYLSRGLLKGLTRDELKGVFLHELHHKRGHDPLKFFLVNLLKDTFFYIPVARLFSEYVHERSEGEADGSAAVGTMERLSLASALVKVARKNSVSPAYAGSYLTGGPKTERSGRLEARIRRLIEGGRLEVATPGKRALAASLLVAALLLLSFTLPLSAAVGPVEACTPEHCSTHMDMLGEECTAHCEMHSHGTGPHSR